MSPPPPPPGPPKSLSLNLALSFKFTRLPVRTLTVLLRPGLALSPLPVPVPGPGPAPSQAQASRQSQLQVSDSTWNRSPLVRWSPDLLAAFWNYAKGLKLAEFMAGDKRGAEAGAEGGKPAKVAKEADGACAQTHKYALGSGAYGNKGLKATLEGGSLGSWRPCVLSHPAVRACLR